MQRCLAPYHRKIFMDAWPGKHAACDWVRNITWSKFLKVPLQTLLPLVRFITWLPILAKVVHSSLLLWWPHTNKCCRLHLNLTLFTLQLCGPIRWKFLWLGGRGPFLHPKTSRTDSSEVFSPAPTNASGSFWAVISVNSEPCPDSFQCLSFVYSKFTHIDSMRKYGAKSLHYVELSKFFST